MRMSRRLAIAIGKRLPVTTGLMGRPSTAKSVPRSVPRSSVKFVEAPLLMMRRRTFARCSMRKTSGFSTGLTVHEEGVVVDVVHVGLHRFTKRGRGFRLRRPQLRVDSLGVGKTEIGDLGDDLLARRGL